MSNLHSRSRFTGHDTGDVDKTPPQFAGDTPHYQASCPAVDHNQRRPSHAEDRPAQHDTLAVPQEPQRPLSVASSNVSASSSDVTPQLLTKQEVICAPLLPPSSGSAPSAHPSPPSSQRHLLTRRALQINTVLAANYESRTQARARTASSTPTSTTGSLVSSNRSLHSSSHGRSRRAIRQNQTMAAGVQNALKMRPPAEHRTDRTVASRVNILTSQQPTATATAISSSAPSSLPRAQHRPSPRETSERPRETPAFLLANDNAEPAADGESKPATPEDQRNKRRTTMRRKSRKPDTNHATGCVSGLRVLLRTLFQRSK